MVSSACFLCLAFISCSAAGQPLRFWGAFAWMVLWEQACTQLFISFAATRPRICIGSGWGMTLCCNCLFNDVIHDACFTEATPRLCSIKVFISGVSSVFVQYIVESARQRPARRRVSSSGRKSLYQKLYELYMEECEKEPELKVILIAPSLFKYSVYVALSKTDSF